jgi:hypothetical protein
VPPVLGKKKVEVVQPDGSKKQYGRNMLIALIIERLTGMGQPDRKQISSHKQVLRNFVKQKLDPNGESSERHSRVGPYPTLSEVEKWMKENNMEETNSDREWKWDAENLRLYCAELNPDYAPASVRTEHALQRQAPASRLPQQFHAAMVSSLTTHVQSMNFNMCLYTQEEMADDKKPPSHTFTTTQSDIGAQPRVLDSIGHWQTYFPKLGENLENGRFVGSDMILLDSDIFLLEKAAPGGSKLSIHFVLNMQGDTAFDSFHITNMHYEDQGHEICNYSKELLWEWTESNGNGQLRVTDIPLKAHWWADTMVKIWTRRKKLEAACQDEVDRVRESG